MSQDEATLLYLLLELIPRIHLEGVRLTVIQCLLIDIGLNLIQQVLHIFLDTVARDCMLLQRITTHDFHRVVLIVTASHHQTDGNALQFVIGKLEARTLVVGIIILHRNAQCTQTVDNASHLCINELQLLVTLIDRHNDNLNRSQLRRQHQSVVIRMGHDERAHQTGRHTP